MLKTTEEIKKEIFDGWDAGARERGTKERSLEEKEDHYTQEYERLMREVPIRYNKAVMEEMPRVIQEAIPFNRHGKQGLYLWGGVGVGKTFALYTIKEYMATQMRKFSVVNVTDMLSQIKNSFNSGNQLDIVDDYGTKIGFDDIGVEKDSDWAGEQIYRLVNYLYENNRSFVFTSNLSLPQLAHRYGDIQGDRIASRIAEMAHVVELKGNDRRV